MIRTMEIEAPQGRLRIEVFDISETLPINSALVSVYETPPENNQTPPQDVLYELVTDESGRTETIVLPAPQWAYSQEPFRPMPYSEFDVFITAVGFEPAIINGVQIYPDTLAIQIVNLLPAVVAEGEKEVNILPPTLWYPYFPPKIPEEEVKPLPESSGFVVLDQVVIPEFIVVHDGKPDDDTAQNYYVPYKDYIKNVACCEIYSTWPDAAIRANVLAIISFTLNRVFTEWYRSRGKNFTITSSTAYDHAFVYGRNIYAEINVIVDEMFTTYIKRFGGNQPLFSQYCDGARVKCPNWLSQWGCKDLGEQGYSAIEILRYYYGDDIHLENATRVSGIPQSYPGSPLTEGSSGENVRIIQNQLNKVASTYSAIPTIRVDGVYGPQTTLAVKAFQDLFNLPQTGIVDFATWYEISRMYVSLARLAEL